jgi:hypothetical protein
MNRHAAHIADIKRRLANLAKAPRCGARTRAGHPCKQAAVSGRARCRIHGGAKGSGGPRGHHNGNFKHGLWTFEVRQMRQAVRVQIRDTRTLIQAMKRVLHCDHSPVQSRSLSFARGFGQATMPPLFRVDVDLASAREESSIKCRGRRVNTVQLARPDAWGRVSIFDHTPGVDDALSMLPKPMLDPKEHAAQRVCKSRAARLSQGEMLKPMPGSARTM